MFGGSEFATALRLGVNTADATRIAYSYWLRITSGGGYHRVATTKYTEYRTLERDMATLASKIKEVCGEDVNLCYQCEKCTSGCPVAFAMDYSPAQVIHASQLDMRDMALNSNTMWLCAFCETCTTRCPQGLDISKVMDSLRIIARREKVEPKVPDVAVLNDLMLKSVRYIGCIYEMGVAAVAKMRSGTLVKEMPLVREYIKKGRLRLLPKFRNIFRINRVFKRVRKYDKF